MKITNNNQRFKRAIMRSGAEDGRDDDVDVRRIAASAKSNDIILINVRCYNVLQNHKAP